MSDGWLPIVSAAVGCLLVLIGSCLGSAMADAAPAMLYVAGRAWLLLGKAQR